MDYYKRIRLIARLEEESEELLEEEAIGLATYSNSKPTVFAYSSIFENPWIHAEIISRDSTTSTPEDE
jgi:hypothetical protein